MNRRPAGTAPIHRRFSVTSSHCSQPLLLKSRHNSRIERTTGRFATCATSISEGVLPCKRNRPSVQRLPPFTQPPKMSTPAPVWRPSVPASEIPINQYREHVNRKFGKSLADSHQLHQWSVASPQDFWVDLWNYTELIPELPKHMTQAYDPRVPMNEIPRFFEGAKINYAENVLTQPNVDPDTPAIIGLREGQGLEGVQWSWRELREKVRQIRSALVRSETKAGDRVAALISTSNWSVAIFLATASLGAVFTSIASDLGTEVRSPFWRRC